MCKALLHPLLRCNKTLCHNYFRALVLNKIDLKVTFPNLTLHFPVPGRILILRLLCILPVAFSTRLFPETTGNHV